MSFIETTFIVIGGIVVAPAVIGILWIIFMGGPLFLAMKTWEWGMIICVNPFLKVINKVPGIGRVITFFIACIIGLASIAFVISIYVPFIGLVAHAIGN